MKVIHYQHNGAGVVISEGLRKIGVESVVAATAPHPFGFKEDYLIKGPEDLREFSDFDVLHSHSEVKLPRKITQLFSGRFVQHYHDSMMGKNERYATLKTAMLGKKRFQLYSNAMNFISTPNIAKFIENATFIPLPVDTSKFYPDRESEEPFTIGYNGSTLDPRKRPYLATKEIMRAVDVMIGKGVEAKLKPQPTEISHDTMREVYWKHIDVWVDRFGLDFYGFSSVEAAACGIPVVCQIGKDEFNFVSACPFVNTNVSELIDTLVHTDFQDKNLKKAHRDFAIDVHDQLRVAQLCKRKFEELR